MELILLLIRACLWKQPAAGGVELVRTAFRALVTVRNRYGKVDVSKFLQAWRERECGFRRGNNINRRVTAR